jgi:uncharacterized protein YggE
MLKTFLAITAAALLVLMPARADEAKLIRSISISGHGEISAMPDLAHITLGVVSSADTAATALAENTRTMTELMALLKEAGIGERDIATSNFSVNPRYDYGQGGNQPPKVVGYDVTNTVTITERRITELGALLDKAVRTGSNQIHGISFSVAEPDAMLDQARQKAIADARHKAEIYASAGGFKLGEVISVAEGGGYQPPPMPVVMKSARAEAAAPVPVAQGEQILAIDVNVTWQIK